MPIVVDASIALAPALEETEPKADLLLQREDSWLVPALWWFELRNGLVMNERRGRLTEQRTERFLQRLSRLPITLDPAPNGTTIMALAHRHRLTVYDAAYLELALRERAPLATLDAALAAAARRECVAVLGDAA